MDVRHARREEMQARHVGLQGEEDEGEEEEEEEKAVEMRVCRASSISRHI